MHEISLARNDEIDQINIFAIKIYSTNSPNQNHFIYTTQFGFEEIEIYAKAMH